MKYLIFIAIFIILIVAGLSCNKEKLIGEYYVSEELKLCNPFMGYETIRFIRNGIVVMELKAENRINESRKYYMDHTNSDYILCEWDNILFQSDYNSIQLYMEACINYPTPQNIGLYFGYPINKYYFTSSYQILSNDGTTKHLDSLLLNGVMYYDIFYDTMNYVLLHGPFPYEDQEYPVKSYYSKSFGILKIDFSDGSTWELQEIIW